MKARKVYEAIGDILKGKSREELVELLRLDELLPRLERGLQAGVVDCEADLEGEDEDYIKEEMPRYVGREVGDEIGSFYNGYPPSDPTDGEDYTIKELYNFIIDWIKKNFPEWKESGDFNNSGEIETFWEYLTDQFKYYG